MGFTAYKSFKLARGLTLEERKGCQTYQASASVNGRVHRYNTETSDYARAERLALSWFKRLSSDRENSPNTPKTLQDAATAFLADLSKPVTRRFHADKWNVLREFFGSYDVDAVTTPVFKEFIRWRKQRSDVSANTIHKDFVTLRRILHHAVEEGWLDRLPLFPKQDKIAANPRPWLDPDEWQTLQRVAKQRIKDAENPRTQRQRAELYDFCLMMVHSCARVDELRRLRVRDCAKKQLPHRDRPHLEMRIQGKTGFRKSIAWSGAVTAFERLVTRGELKPDDFLFSEHHRDGFRELLDAAGLRRDAEGRTRNLKSLRSTGLMMRIRANPRINLKLLADNAGTSVAMLDTFYLKRLTVDMGVDELV